MQTISLVIGTYNPKIEWLDNALKSAEGLFDQTVVVDDCSPTPVPNATARHETNKKFFEARNTGCKLAETDWIASLDDDDEFIRENVEELKQIMQTTDADILHFPIELFGDQQGYWAVRPNIAGLLDSNQIPSGSWFRKDVFEKLNGFQLAEGEDWDFWARAYKHKFKFQYYPKPIYRHRMRKGSMSADWVGDKFIEIKNNVRKNYDKEQI